MTTGGTLVVGQSGGPTTVINCSLAGVVAEALDAGDAVGDVLGLHHGVEGLLAGEFRDLRRQDSSLVRELRDTPSSALGSCRYKLGEGDLERALAALRSVEARYFVYIGGNDSADTTHRLAMAARETAYDLRCIGVPKTVDNDLVETDHCPGYGSAARFLAIAAMEVSRDTEAMQRSDPVKILEVAGRHAGWLAAASALGRRSDEEGPHLVYLPERPVSADTILDQVAGVHERYGHAVLVLSENQTAPSGSVLGAGGEPSFVDAFGHAYHDSPAAFLARAIRERLGLRARFEKPGTLQRMSVAYRSDTDADEAFEVGRAAVRMALEGMTDRMAVLKRESDEPYRWSVGDAPLMAIANQQRVLPPELIGDPGAGPTAAFRRYAMPLLGAPLPRHVRIT